MPNIYGRLADINWFQKLVCVLALCLFA